MLIKRLAALLAVFAIIAAEGAERGVEVVNPADGIRLAGTLALPDSVRPKAYIVLVTGSGAQNRDEQVSGHRPFRILSDRLVAVGYGVLRMDDRGVGGSGGDSSAATIADLVGDVEAAVAFLRDAGHSEIPVGTIGHSLGGQVALNLAARGITDFTVTLGAPAVPGDSLIMQQSRTLATALTGRWDAEPLQRTLLEAAKSPLSDFVARGVMYSLLSEHIGEALSLPAVRQNIGAQLDAMLAPSYRDILRHDPADDIRAVRVPWLAVNGERDTQVDVSNIDTIRDLNPGANVTLAAVPGHNHLLQECATGMTDEYERLGQSPSPSALVIIVGWLARL